MRSGAGEGAVGGTEKCRAVWASPQSLEGARVELSILGSGNHFVKQLEFSLFDLPLRYNSGIFAGSNRALSKDLPFAPILSSKTASESRGDFLSEKTFFGYGAEMAAGIRFEMPRLLPGVEWTINLGILQYSLPDPKGSSRTDSGLKATVGFRLWF